MKEFGRSLMAGLIASSSALIATYIVYLVGVKFTTFGSALIAVGIASFISGCCGWYFAKKR